MQVIDEYNNVSLELYNELVKPLEHGEVVWFRMLHGIKNPDIYPCEPGEAPKPATLFGAKQIPTQDRIKDPYKTNKEGKKSGGFVTIGVPDHFNEQGRPDHTRMLVPGMGIGMFGLTGGNVEDEEMYEYLMLCDFRGDKPGRDTRKEAIFEVIEYKEDAKKKKAGRKPAAEKEAALT